MGPAMTAFPAATVSAPPTSPEPARAQGVDGWPAADTPVLANRPLRPGADPTPTRFGDQVWRLDPAHPDSHADLDPIHWARFPPQLTPAFKTFALAALDHPFPAQAPARTHVDRPAVSTIINWISYLRLFAAWTHQRGVARLPDLTGRDLDAYRDHVLASAAAAKRKAALLGAVRTLWSYRALLPADCQIACDPFGGATGNHLAGRPSADRVNKTPRIAAPPWRHCSAGRCGWSRTSAPTSWPPGRNTANSTTATTPRRRHWPVWAPDSASNGSCVTPAPPARPCPDTPEPHHRPSTTRTCHECWASNTPTARPPGRLAGGRSSPRRACRSLPEATSAPSPHAWTDAHGVTSRSPPPNSRRCSARYRQPHS